jgi:hypothetical protein
MTVKKYNSEIFSACNWITTRLPDRLFDELRERRNWLVESVPWLVDNCDCDEHFLES